MTSSKVTTQDFSSNKLINDLVKRNYYRNKLEKFADNNITYSFHQKDDFINEYGKRSYSVEWKDNEKARFLDAFNLFSSVSDLTFTNVGTNHYYYTDFDLRKADTRYDTTNEWSKVGAYANFPNETPSQSFNDIVFRKNYYDADSNATAGKFNFHTKLHEMGHGLGLMHPHAYGLDNVRSSSDRGEHGLNDIRYTNMSYIRTPNYYPETLMVLDIAAIQYLYGKDMTTATGNNTYKLDDVVNKSYKAIWDAGGNDNIEYNGSQNVVIDLRAGHLNQNASAIRGEGYVKYSYNGAAGYFSGLYDGAQYDDSGAELKGGYYIANGVVIENATGGSGNDRLIGNSSNNTLSGRGGEDKLFGKDGNDSLFGGDGNDTLIGGNGADRLNGGSGNDRAKYETSVVVDLQNTGKNTGEARGDTYVSIEDLEGSHYGDQLYGNDGNNGIWGGNGNDILSGRNGNDVLFGDNGGDILYGGNGHDYLFGGHGNDIILGGNGNDYVYGDYGNDSFYGEGGNDYFVGGNGADDYNYFFGHGADVIDDYATDGAKDQLFLAFSTNNINVSVSWLYGYDLLMDFGSGNSIKFINWKRGDDYQVEEFVFDNATYNADDFLLSHGLA